MVEDKENLLKYRLFIENNIKLIIYKIYGEKTNGTEEE